jgi:hypothetical protein
MLDVASNARYIYITQFLSQTDLSICVRSLLIPFFEMPAKIIKVPGYLPIDEPELATGIVKCG